MFNHFTQALAPSQSPSDMITSAWSTCFCPSARSHRSISSGQYYAPLTSISTPSLPSLSRRPVYPSDELRHRRFPLHRDSTISFGLPRVLLVARGHHTLHRFIYWPPSPMSVPASRLFCWPRLISRLTLRFVTTGFWLTRCCIACYFRARRNLYESNVVQQGAAGQPLGLLCRPCFP
ncbi:hypothetical protein BH11VER1_BH11VER1_18740 [soil metagenome]